MNEQRKTELIDKFLAYMLEHYENDEDLYLVLTGPIGMTREEINDFGIEGLDEYFDKNNRSDIHDSGNQFSPSFSEDRLYGNSLENFVHAFFSKI